MHRQEIAISFSELRKLATTVSTYLAHFLGVDKAINLRTAVEEDLGLYDLDAEMLLLEFSEKYQVDLSDFDFTGLIKYDGWAPFPGIAHLMLLVFLGLMLFPAWLVKILAGAACWPCDSVWALAIWKIRLHKIFFPFIPFQQPLPSQVLTLGDFVASAAVGRFVKRERVRFVLV